MAVLASLLFGESIGLVGAAGLILGVIGLLLLEVCSFEDLYYISRYNLRCSLVLIFTV